MKSFFKAALLILTGGTLIGLGSMIVYLILEKRHKVYFEMGIKELE